MLQVRIKLFAVLIIVAAIAPVLALPVKTSDNKRPRKATTSPKTKEQMCVV